MAQTEEHKTAKALMRGVGSLTFDPYAFAYVVTNDDPILQARVMQAFLAFVYQMAEKMASDSLQDANADAIVTARRIVDALEAYDAE